MMVLGVAAGCSQSGSSEAGEAPTSFEQLPSTTASSVSTSTSLVTTTTKSFPPLCEDWTTKPPNVDQAFEPGTTRVLSMSLASSMFDPQAALDPSAAQFLPLQITRSVEVTSVSIDEQGWHLVWRDLIGEHLRNYSAKLPDGAGDRITGDEVVEIEYLVRPDGEVQIETPDDQIAERYSAVNRLAAGEGSLFDEFAVEVVVASTGFAVLFPERAPGLTARVIEIYHQGHGLSLEQSDGEFMAQWSFPFSAQPISLPTDMTVTERESDGCLSLDAVAVAETGTATAESLASVVGSPPDWDGIDWRLTSASHRDIRTGVALVSEVRVSAVAEDGRVATQSVALVDDAFTQWNFGARD